MEVGRYQDPCLPSPPCEPIPQDLGCSRQRFEQESSQSEPDLREECVKEMERRACHLDTSNAIAGQGSNSQETNRHLGVCGQHMLRDWFTPRRNTVWPETKVNSSLGKLALVLDQQSILDCGIRLDQWTLEKWQAAEPFKPSIGS